LAAPSGGGYRLGDGLPQIGVLEHGNGRFGRATLRGDLGAERGGIDSIPVLNWVV
jgi:hypothetical protein